MLVKFYAWKKPPAVTIAPWIFWFDDWSCQMSLNPSFPHPFSTLSCFCFYFHFLKTYKLLLILNSNNQRVQMLNLFVSYSILLQKNENRKIICNTVLTRLSSKAWLPQHVSRSVQFQFVFLILTITHSTTITVTAIYWRQIICKLHARCFVIPNPQNSPSV